MIEMVRRFLRQKARSGGTLVLLGLLAAMSGLSIAVSGGPGGPGGGGYVALLVLAAASRVEGRVLRRPADDPGAPDPAHGLSLRALSRDRARRSRRSRSRAWRSAFSPGPSGVPAARSRRSTPRGHRIRDALGGADGGGPRLFLDVPAGLRRRRGVAAPADLRLAADQRAVDGQDVAGDRARAAPLRGVGTRLSGRSRRAGVRRTRRPRGARSSSPRRPSCSPEGSSRMDATDAGAASAPPGPSRRFRPCCSGCCLRPPCSGS